MRLARIEGLLLWETQVWRRHANLVEDVIFVMRIGCFAVGAQVEVWTVGAVPPGASDRLLVAPVARNATMYNALQPRAVLCNVVQGALKGLAFGINSIIRVLVASQGQICSCDTLSIIESKAVAGREYLRMPCHGAGYLGTIQCCDVRIAGVQPSCDTVRL